MRIPWRELVLFGVAYMVGDAFSAPQWITIGAICLIVLGGIGWAIEVWRTRHERRDAGIHERVTKPSRWRARYVEQRKDEELQAFLDSPAGEHIQELLKVVDGSVEIHRIGDELPKPVGSAHWVVQIDDTRVACVDLDTGSIRLTWRQRTVRAVAWLSNRPWWVGRPMTMRILAWVLPRLGARLRKPGHSARVHQRLGELVRKNRAKSRPKSLDTRDPLG